MRRRTLHCGGAPQDTGDRVGRGVRHTLARVWMAHSRVGARPESLLVDHDTGELIFNVFDQIEYLSQAMTLEPGDVVFTGTPAGIGAAMKPPVFLKAGDRVRCEIDELGAIETVCENEA